MCHIIISIGLPQSSSLSPYLLVVFHSDLITNTGAFPARTFADDLNVLVRAPVEKKLEPILQFSSKKALKCVINSSINLSKSV